MNTDLMFSSESQEWETPPDLFRKLDRVYHFTLDVCATVQNALCARYYSKADDGLSKDWRGEVCFMNPPYGRRTTGLWLAKAFSEGEAGATVVCLVPARTDTAAWHDFAMQGKIKFLRGRLTFLEGGMPRLDANDRPMPAGFPSAIVVFGPGRSLEIP